MYFSLSAQPSTLSVSLTDYSNTAFSYGPTLFVDMTSLSSLSIEQFPDFMSCDENVAKQAYGKVGSNSADTLANLLNYTTSHCFRWECSEGEPNMTEYDGVIYVDPSSTADATSCGANDYACATLYGATQTSSFSSSSSGTIILLQTTTHSTLNTGLSVTSKVTIQGYCESSSESTIVEVSSGECMLSASTH